MDNYVTISKTEHERLLKQEYRVQNLCDEIAELKNTISNNNLDKLLFNRNKNELDQEKKELINKARIINQYFKEYELKRKTIDTLTSENKILYNNNQDLTIEIGRLNRQYKKTLSIKNKEIKTLKYLLLNIQDEINNLLNKTKDN